MEEEKSKVDSGVSLKEKSDLFILKKISLKILITNNKTIFYLIL